MSFASGNTFGMLSKSVSVSSGYFFGMLLPSVPRSPSFGAILHVFLSGSDVQMFRVYARRIIAFVHHIGALWNFLSGIYHPACPVRKSSNFRKLTIPRFEFGSCPHPARGESLPCHRPIFIYFSPKSFLGFLRYIDGDSLLRYFRFGRFHVFGMGFARAISRFRTRAMARLFYINASIVQATFCGCNHQPKPEPPPSYFFSRVTEYTDGRVTTETYTGPTLPDRFLNDE